VPAREREAQAEAEGLDQVFKTAGFEWREPGCSMCLAMNNETVPPASAASPPLTATSSAARGRAAHHLASPPWPPPPRWRHIVDVRTI